VRIDESMKLFLKELSEQQGSKTAERYRHALDLFHDYLANYADLSYEEHKEKGIVLTADTQELHDGQVSNFLEWFLIRKVLGPAWLNTAAPGIMKKYIKWLDKKGLLADGSMDEIAEATKKASKDLPRVEKAATLLYELCDKNSERLSVDDFDDKDYMEGYGEVTGIIEDYLHLNYEGDKTGPIHITKEIAKLLKKGDTVNLVVGRKGKLWYPLEVGNVYPG
jgi:soluble cytochrome b562